MPAPVAKAVDDAVDIFTFGIGAGPASCGQLLLGYDLLGVFDQFKPKFTKRYAELSEVAVAALKAYAAEVRDGKFPDADHSYAMKPEEAEKLQEHCRSRHRKMIVTASWFGSSAPQHESDTCHHSSCREADRM